MEVFAQLGIDGRLLIAQIVNIVILIVVLYWVLHKPILRMLDSRSQMIAKSVEQAKETERTHSQVAIEKEEILKQARLHAQDIISAAKETATAHQASAVATAKEDIARLIAGAKKQIQQERVQSVQQARKDLADIVLAATHTVLSQTITESVDRALVQQAIDEITNKRV